MHLKTLNALRRWQFLLLMGGGSLITVFVLLACALQIWVSVTSYVSTAKEDMVAARQRSEHAMLNMATTMRDIASLWAARVENAPENDETLQKHLATSAASTLSSLERSVYVLDSALTPLAVSHNTGITRLSKNIDTADISGVTTVLQDIIRPYFRKPKAYGLDALNDFSLQWFPIHISSVTGQSVVSAAMIVKGFDDELLGAIVVELPLSTLNSILTWERPYGGYSLIDGYGQPILSSVQPELSDALQAVSETQKNGGVAKSYSAYENGYLLSSSTLTPTPWRLLYLLPREAIIAGVAGPVTASIVTSAIIIIVAWTLLLMVRRKVFVPAMFQSQLMLDSEQLNRVLVQTAPVGLGLIELSSGRLLLRSKLMEEIEAVAIIPGNDLSSELCALFHGSIASDGGDTTNSHSLQLTLATVSGVPMVLSVRLTKARYNGQDALIVAFTDITIENRAERALNEACHAADSASAAKSAFLAAMSHEIRTPITAIQGNLELLAHSQLNPVQRDRLAIIRAAFGDLFSTVSDVLDFSKIEAGELHLEQTSFDVNEVAERALVTFAPLARSKGLLLTSDFGKTPSQIILGDPTRLMQVLSNLLSNALKFTSSGSVSLSVRVDPAERYLAVAVTDTGMGMSDDQMSRLFSAFSQADNTITRRFGGTGLGLALCERLVTAMGGTITATSELGKGSQFMLRIPLHGEAMPNTLPNFYGKKVAVIADNADVSVLNALRAWGLQAEWYVSSISNFPETLPGIEIVILWGECDSLDLDQASRLAVDASWIIKCRADHPSRPVISGRIINVSTYGLQGLVNALEYALLKRIPPTHEPTHEVFTRRINVLLVEDHPVTRELLEEQLTLLGCDVRSASDGEEALRLIALSPCEILLTDLLMPKISGQELVRRVRLEWPRLPILILTADLTAHSIRDFAHDTHIKILGKPLTLKTLGTAISVLSGLSSVCNVPSTHESSLNNRPVSAELLTIFYAANEHSIEVMCQAWRDQDAARLLAELHSVRGALSVFGMDFLSEQGAALSTALQIHEMHECSVQFKRFCFDLRLTFSAPSKQETLHASTCQYA